MEMTAKRIEKTLEELNSLIYSHLEAIQEFQVKEGFFKTPEEADRAAAPWGVFHSTERWGGMKRHYWFQIHIVVSEACGDKALAFQLRTGRGEGTWDAAGNPQFLVFVNGQLCQGMDANHRELLLTDRAIPGMVFEIGLQAYSGITDELSQLFAGIVRYNRDIEQLYYDMKILFDAANYLGEYDYRRTVVYTCLNETVNKLDLRVPFSSEFHKSVAAARKYLMEEYYQKHCGGEEATAHSVGHTHIDVAWLWTLAQTREKAIRSFSTALGLMEEYPEYIFMSSQPQLYEYVKEDRPDLFEKIRNRIAEGRWEAEGAMWLEADCNLASGESLIRQIVFGMRFFLREFGVRNEILWLPDVFGYSAALPQIMKKCGIRYFMTSKISWSEYNKIPYDTFLWRGLDGTEVLTQFLTAVPMEFLEKTHKTNYIGEMIPSDIIGSWARYQQKHLNDTTLVTYGYADGGGGPTRGMLEAARRMACGIPGCPRVKLGTALEFFRNLEKTTAGHPKLPRWVGELYLEYHRGTYTSMARSKKLNRASEFAVMEAELWAAVKETLQGFVSYPRDRLDKVWKLILLNQFHDVLPGTSIKEVYEESWQQYGEILETAAEEKEKAIAGIAERIGLEREGVVVFNSLGFDRNDPVEVDLADFEGDVVFADDAGRLAAAQRIDAAGGKIRFLFVAPAVPAKGYRVFYPQKAVRENQSSAGVEVTTERMANRFFEIRFDACGQIVSIYDKRCRRELLKTGHRANVLQAFEDRPLGGDAWDINLYYQEKMWELTALDSVEVVEAGPVRAVLRQSRRFMNSVIRQDIRIYSDIPRVDFVTTVDWKEKQILLKAAFPMEVHTDKATYEIQFGNVERPTHWNTSWDFARFEVCAHRWADISEDGYGVSLLNDSKYGYDIKDGVMRLSLIKSPVFPNPDADREVHEFTYSLFPHPDSWKEAETVRMGYRLNCPLQVRREQAHAGSLPAVFSFAGVDCRNVILETVKQADDGEGTILRLYECHNRTTQVTVKLFTGCREAWECDLLENKHASIPVEKNGLTFEMKPYEIRTIRVLWQ